MDAGLTGRVVLVTGGGGGVGPTLCQRFADEGATVAVHYRRSKARAEAAVSAIRAAGGRAAAFQCDLGDTAAIGRMVAAIGVDLGPPVVAINGTSNFRTEELTEIDDEGWGSVVDDMLGAATCPRESIARARRFGSRLPSAPHNQRR